MLNKKLTELIATFFYVGRLPVIPGTTASAAGALLCFIFAGNMLIYLLIFMVVTGVGFWVCGRMEEIVGKKDPSCVVIDEVSGVMIAFFLLPMSWSVVITAFFVFRAFDMFKVYPVNKFEYLKGSVGIMMDDIIAGIYTNITMHLAIRFAGLMQ